MANQIYKYQSINYYFIKLVNTAELLYNTHFKNFNLNLPKIMKAHIWKSRSALHKSSSKKAETCEIANKEEEKRKENRINWNNSGLYFKWASRYVQEVKSLSGLLVLARAMEILLIASLK